MTAAFDSISAGELRSRGSLKWSLFPDTIGAFVAEMDFGTAPVITKALHAAVDAQQFGYLPTALADELGFACAAWQRDAYGWEVPAGDVHPLPDVIKGLEVAIEHYSAPGSKVIVPTPAYMPFLTVPSALGREILEVSLALVDGTYRMGLEALDAAFVAGGGLLVLCNPYNPVGRVFDETELTAISEVVERHGGRVFADEIHAPLIFPGRTHVPYASISAVTANHSVTATSASKAWNLPGLKCAQLIVTNHADRATWDEIAMMASHGTANLGVVANVAAYTQGRPWLDGVLDYLDGSRILLADLLAEHLPEVGYCAPEGTYIGWLDCRELGLEDPATFFRERAGVALTDGVSCGTPGFVRMIFATPRPILQQAIRQLATALAAR
ncbi:MAG: MalY/PatB family protein [Propionibacteriaceae bacterium]